MPDEPGFGLTAGSIQTLRRLRQRVDALPPRQGATSTRTKGAGAAAARVPYHGWVRLTSATPDAGRYPGVACVYDADGQTYSDVDASSVWVAAADGGALATGVHYWGRLEADGEGSTPDDFRPVYVVDEPAASVADVSFTASGVVNLSDQVLGKGVKKFAQTSPLGGETWLLAAGADATTGVTHRYATVSYVGGSPPAGTDDIGSTVHQFGYTAGGVAHAGTLDLTFPADTAGPVHHGPSVVLSGYSPRYALFIVGSGLFIGQTGTLPDGSQVTGGIITVIGTGVGLTVGTTTVASGADKQLLYDNGGTLGEATGVRIRSNNIEPKLASGKWALCGVASY